jgi:hypothetical protein
MTKVHVPLSADEYNLLHRISSSEFRLPEQMLRWLLHQEAARRGLSNQVIRANNTTAHALPEKENTGAFNRQADSAGVIATR